VGAETLIAHLRMRSEHRLQEPFAYICVPAAQYPKNPYQPNVVLCEEVRENGASEDYRAGRSFWSRRDNLEEIDLIT
jgi:hypothetical protein